MISAQNLTKQYGEKTALDHLTLDIAPGEIFCLLRQNGAGTSRDSYSASENALDEAQKNWAGWFLKKFDADQTLSVADYDEFMRFPDRVATASVPGSNAGAFLLVLQCLLAGAWAWWSGRRRSLVFA